MLVPPRNIDKITDVQVIVTCSVGQAYILTQIMTDAGVYGVGEGDKNGHAPRRWE
jgi:hypothetical protein